MLVQFSDCTKCGDYLHFNGKLRARVRGLPFRCKVLGADKKSSRSPLTAQPGSLAWLFWIPEEFSDQIILGLGELKLVNQKIAAAEPLTLFPNQERIQ